MKSLKIRAGVLLCLGLLIATGQELTQLPVPRRQVAPHITVNRRNVTNDVPLIVCRSIEEQVVQTTLWYDETGKLQRTETVLATSNTFSGVLSVEVGNFPKVRSYELNP